MEKIPGLPPRPPFIENPDLTTLRGVVEEYLAFLEGDGYDEDQKGDAKQYIFEAAVEALWGPQAFPYIRQVLALQNKRLNP